MTSETDWTIILAMNQTRTDPALVFPKRPKDGKLDGSTRCPTCSTTVKYCGASDDPDEVIAANCQFYCERTENKWIDDPRCYAKAYIPEIKKYTPKPKSKKKSSYYKNKKKVSK